MTLGTEVARLLKESGKNMKQVSLEADLNQTYVRDVIKGKSRDPSAEKLARLAGVLGVTLDELRAGASIETSDKFAKNDEELTWLQLWRGMKNPARASALAFFLALIPLPKKAAPTRRDDAA